MEQYLKAHTGGPAASEFDWGSGETPRRSARISEKAKAAPPRETEPPKKRSRKTSASKQDNKEKEAAFEKNEETKVDVTQENQKTEKDAAHGETKEDVVKDENESQLPKDAETTSEAGEGSLKDASAVKDVVNSGITQNEKETSHKKPQVEVVKDVNFGQQGKEDKLSAGEKKYEVDEKEKEKSNRNDEHTGSGVDEGSKTVVEATQNGRK